MWKWTKWFWKHFRGPFICGLACTCTYTVLFTSRCNKSNENKKKVWSDWITTQLINLLKQRQCATWKWVRIYQLIVFIGWFCRWHYNLQGSQLTGSTAPQNSLKLFLESQLLISKAMQGPDTYSEIVSECGWISPVAILRYSLAVRSTRLYMPRAEISKPESMISLINLPAFPEKYDKNVKKPHINNALHTSLVWQVSLLTTLF